MISGSRLVQELLHRHVQPQIPATDHESLVTSHFLRVTDHESLIISHLSRATNH